MTRGRARAGLALLLAVIAMVAVAAVYWTAPPAATVDAGGPFSGPLLAGFYADEAEQGGRYRWTKGHAEITFADVGAGDPLVFRFRVAPRPADAPLAPFTVTVDSRVVATYTLNRTATEYRTAPVARPSANPGAVLGFDVPTFQAAGDTRNLGLKLQWARAEPAPGAPRPGPPPLVLLEGALLAAGLFLLLERALGGPILAVAATGAVVALLVAGLVTARSLLAPWLPPLAALAGLGGLAAVAWPLLIRWPASLDALRAPRSRVAVGLLALVLLGYAAFTLSVLPAVEWIGHADYADNAVVARNLADGRGPVVDYVPQFYRAYPGLTHPADTWPPLQPLLIAPFFLLLGPGTWIAKLPNLFVLLALAGAVYAFAARWWDRRVALLGAVLTLLHPYFFQAVLYPINDLGFTLLAFLTLGWAWEAAEAQAAGYRTARARAAAQAEPPAARTARPAAPDAPAPAPAAPAPGIAAPRWPATRYAVLAGLSGGLLLWSKGASGLALLGGLGLALGWHTWRARWAGRRPPRDLRLLAWGAGAFAVVAAALLVRNWLVLGTPYFSTESYDTWILRFWTGGAPQWEPIYADYLDGRPLPDRSLLLRSYETLYFAVQWGFASLWNGGVLNGDILDLPVVLAGLGGWLLAARRLAGLRLLWIGTFVVYSLFVLLAWHYEARYFAVLVPWFYLGTAALLFWVWDQAAALRPVAGRVLLPLGALALLLPSLLAIAGRAGGDSGPNSFATAGRWAAAHLPAGAVVMTRNPWEFNWYAERPAVMIPAGPLSDIRAVIARYHVAYLWLGGAGDSTSPRSTPLRPALTPLYRRQPLPDLPATLVYDGDGILIYRLAGGG